jgi:hypothetical protein
MAEVVIRVAIAGNGLRNGVWPPEPSAGLRRARIARGSEIAQIVV